MSKRLIFLLSVAAFTLFYACGNNNNDNPADNFDHAAQAVKDNDSLLVYLRNNYYDNATDSIRPLVTGQTALIDDPRLMQEQVTEQEVDYTLYYFVTRVGDPDPVKGFPTVADSVLTRYDGRFLAKTDSLVLFDRRVTPLWFTLTSVIRGWAFGFTHFKGGRNITSNGPITFADGGKGVLFIPSGLAYRNLGNVFVPGNTPLIFHFDLYDIVENTDQDNDGIPSILEDIDGDGDPRNDDTDNNNVPNFIDIDDDGDGVRTADEDANGDGDPTNDFSDPNNPTLPDYLNPNITVNHNI